MRFSSGPQCMFLVCVCLICSYRCAIRDFLGFSSFVLVVCPRVCDVLLFLRFLCLLCILLCTSCACCVLVFRFALPLGVCLLYVCCDFFFFLLPVRCAPLVCAVFFLPIKFSESANRVKKRKSDRAETVIIYTEVYQYIYILVQGRVYVFFLCVLLLLFLCTPVLRCTLVRECEFVLC